MKKNALVIGLLLNLIFFIACNKKDAQENTPKTTQSVSDYFPLAVGNYWVYKQSEADSSGNIISQNWLNDSVVVKNDTVINSKNYHIVANYHYLGNTNPFFSYYRDSSDCIVDEGGGIVFNINTSGIIYKHILSPDTVAYVDYSYNGTPTSITVPLGTYSCVDFKGEMYRKADNFSKSYLIHNYNSLNIGSVKKTQLFVNSLYRLTFDLVAYHVQ